MAAFRAAFSFLENPMKRSLIALAAIAACGASAGWSRRDDSQPHGHELRVLSAGGLFADNEDDLAGLSEQERAALQEPTGGEEEETLRAIAGKAAPGGEDTVVAATGEDTLTGGDEEEEDEDAAGQDTTAGADTTAGSDTAAGADTATGAQDTVQGPAQDTVAGAEKAAAAEAAEPVSYTIAAPEDADAQIKALRTEKAAAFKQLMDGDLTPEQYSAKEDEVTGKISEIERQVTAARVATEISVQNAQRSYLGKVNALLDRARDVDGVDYRAEGNKHLHDALDRTVKWLANDPSNADKPEQWFLDEAHAMVKGRFGVGKAAAAPAGQQGGADGKPAAAKPPATTSRAGKAPDLSGVPPTVRNLPAAADGGATGDDGGEFAHLNGLTGMALERAVARMTPEQQQRWAEA